MTEEGRTVFNLADLNPGIWFTMEGGGRICLRTCTGESFRNIRNQTMMRKVEYRKGTRYEYEEFKVGGETEQNYLIWDYSIVNWENIFDADGIPIPCSAEMKRLLMDHSFTFSSFVNNKLLELMKLERESVEVEEKNL